MFIIISFLIINFNNVFYLNIFVININIVIFNANILFNILKLISNLFNSSHDIFQIDFLFKCILLNDIIVYNRNINKLIILIH